MLKSEQVIRYLRSHLRKWLPSFSQRRYQRWALRRSQHRLALYTTPPEAGLFSILSAVWDGSPAIYLKALAESIAVQNEHGGTEWVIVDNGCRNPELLTLLQQLSQWAWVRIVRLENNSGIVGGLRTGLEAARGRYTLAVDGDDLLYRDALFTVAHHVRELGYPMLLYTDEDKVKGTQFSEPYLKPDWDPVLILNSPYIAHLGIADRRTALEVGGYTNKNAEGSPDWDLFMRFWIAGHAAQHIPEVVYSWRMHSTSTAESVTHKSYIHSSQKAVLETYVRSLPDAAAFEAVDSPWSTTVPQFRIVKRAPSALQMVKFAIESPAMLACNLVDVVEQAFQQRAFLVLHAADFKMGSDDWMSEAESLFDLHADAVMLGGRIVDSKNRISEAGCYFGFRGVCGDPYRSFPATEPGYFGDLWKRRSISAVSTHFSIVRPEFLREVLKNIPATTTAGFLGAWAGAHAMRTGKRVIYSPFLGGISQKPWGLAQDGREEQVFAEANRDLIPDTRFYSRHFSRVKAFKIES